MTFSIIIPLYNKADYVLKTLEAIIQQTCLPTELIIVDDASTDNSIELVESYIRENATQFREIRLHIIKLTENKGASHARNLGLEKATSELISFLDADDFYDSRFIEITKTAIEKHNLAALVISIEYQPFKEIEPDVSLFKDAMHPIDTEIYEIHNPLEIVSDVYFTLGVGNNLVLRRFWIGNERYETSATLNENIDFFYRIFKHIVAQQQTPRVALLAGGYLKVNEVVGSISRKNYQSWKEIELPFILKRYGQSSDKYDNKLIRKIVFYWFRHGLTMISSFKQRIVFAWQYRMYIGMYMRVYFSVVVRNLLKKVL